MGAARERPPAVSFVIPAFDEEAGIALCLRSVLAAADRIERSVGPTEVVVVDDGSGDRTAAEVAAVAAADRRVRLVAHGGRRGLGAAVRTGFAATTGDIVVYTDADEPFDLAALDGVLERLVVDDEVDLVSLFRASRRQEGPRRFVYSVLYNGLVRVVLGLRARDVNFAGKVVRRRVLDALELKSEGSFIDAEILARAARSGFTCAQDGVEYHPRSRGVSTLSSWATIRTMLAEMRALRPEIVALGPRRR